jgi:hypothetical protein
MTMSEPISHSTIRRFSSRRQELDRTFLAARLQGALAYDRIAGYFRSSLLEIAGEELESVAGQIRIVCNSDLNLLDVRTARAAHDAVRRSWCASAPEALLEGPGEPLARDRFKRLFDLLVKGNVRIRVLPDEAFGLIHGKAGVITLADGSKTCFMGSANESLAAWKLNYELVWEDRSPEAIGWVEEEFEALWTSPYATPLADAVIKDIQRLSERRVLSTVREWTDTGSQGTAPDPAPTVVEAPVYRKEVGLWEHQKYFVKQVVDAHSGRAGKARYVLADQVGLGKTLQLAMAAQIIGLTGDKPILVICPKTLIWQWQGEMDYLLDMPSAVWNGRQWVDERGVEYPVLGPIGIRRCPRRVGIVSSGLIKRRSEAAQQLLSLEYDCVILDEAHHARRRNLGDGRDGENPDPNNLLRFMYDISQRTQSLLLATATPVQLRPVEAWDLLDILSGGDDAVLGNPFSRWRQQVQQGLDLVMRRSPVPQEEGEQWEWIRNPLPPSSEDRDFEVLRSYLNIQESECVVRGDAITSLPPPARQRLGDLFPRLVADHNPFIRRIIRRTREQLESQIDPETGEPLLRRIRVELLGESDRDAIRLPPYLREAYEHAEGFCRALSRRMAGAGFLKTLLLRRIGSSVHAGMMTAQRMLASWSTEEWEEDDEDVEELVVDGTIPEAASESSRTLTPDERAILERLVGALEANRERDPKYDVVLACLLGRGWLDMGCIIFSQYRDSLQWLATLLTEELPEEQIGLYSGPTTSGIMHGGRWTRHSRDDLKGLVMSGRLRLLLGTDAASEGINLQRMARLINLDLPWNPTRLEQRKGRIQRIGQIHDVVQIYNMRYKDSVEDRVHELLSSRLRDIYDLFGQLPDVLEDAWIAMALGERERAKKVIDEVPQSHPFEVRYTEVENSDWESCRLVLDSSERRAHMNQGW